MSEIAKKKRDQKRQDAKFNNEGEFDLEKTIEERERATHFEAPGKERKARVKNLVTLHWKLMGLACPYYPNVIHVFGCVIDHANQDSGRCDAGQTTLGIESGVHRNTVKRILDWVAANTTYLRIEQRRGKAGRYKTSAYHINWEALEADWKAVQHFIGGEKAFMREPS